MSRFNVIRWAPELPSRTINVDRGRLVNVDRADRIHPGEPGKPNSDIIDYIASVVPYSGRRSGMVMQHAISKIDDFSLAGGLLFPNLYGLIGTGLIPTVNHPWQISTLRRSPANDARGSARFCRVLA